MPDSGPTTVGSIVGKLRMDFDQWLVDKARAKEDAREIGALNPTVRVSMDTSSALAQIEALRIAAERAGVVRPGAGPVGPSAATVAKIDAVAAAERRLQAAESASESATARAIVAEMKLEESRNKRGRTAAQLAAAELATAEAIKRADAAAERAVFAEQALAVAQQKAARAALEQAAAQEAAAVSTVKANEANKTSWNRFGLISTAIGILVPLLIPVAGLAIGIAGALTLMGAAGVLAVFGIKKEMADGSAVGAQYSRGLSSLKKDMDGLSRTSAVNMLSSFNRVIGETNAAMPMLNRQVGFFSGLLGRSGANLFAGSIQGLKVLEPLLLTVGVYLEGLTKKFQNWTGNGGLEKFGNWAMSVLPQAERLLGSLSAAVMHLLEALAPLGTIGAMVFTSISDAINGTPVGVLSALIGAVLWGTLAFKAWGFIAPMLSGIATSMGAVGAATTIATGPIGWLLAGVGALAAVFAVAAVNAQGAATAVATYTSAVQADTGAIGENVRATAAKALLDAGALDAAKKLGISRDLVLRATLGEADAVRELTDALAIGTNGSKLQKDQLEKTGLGLVDYGLAVETVKQALDKQSGGIKGAVDDYRILHEALGDVTTATDSQRVAIEAGARAAGVSVDAYRNALAAQGDTKAQLEKTTAAMYLQNDAAGLLKQSLDLLNGKTISAAQAQNQFDSQIANMSTHMDASGKVINRADTLLTGMTASAVKNRGELISLTSAAEANAQAFRDNGGSAEETRQKLIDMKQTIIDNAVAHGEDRKQVEAFVDAIFKIPSSIPATKIEVEAAAALALLLRLKSLLDNLRKPVSISVTGAPTIGKGTQAFAGGGTVQGEGGPKDDKVWVRASPGEEFVQEPQASKYRSLLKAINSDNLAGFALPAGVVKGANVASQSSQAAPPPSISNTQTSTRGGDFNVTLVNPISRDPVREIREARDLQVAAQEAGLGV